MQDRRTLSPARFWFCALFLAALTVGSVMLLAQHALTVANIAPPSPPEPVPAPASIPVVPQTPPPTPVPTPVGNAEHGRIIADRVLARYPKLKVTVLSGMTFQKHGGIDLWGSSGGRPTIGFILPQPAWDALNPGEKQDLAAYVQSQVAAVRLHPEDYITSPSHAPVFPKAVGYTRHIDAGAWFIGNTKTYPDDADQNLYLDTKLVKGSAVFW